jgi:ankyrin repeat protein
MNEEEFPMQPLPPNERAFLEAAKAGEIDRLNALLGKVVPVDVQDVGDMPWNQTALMYAAQNGHVDAVILLLRAGARVFAKDKDLPGEPAGRQPLHYAVRSTSLEVIEILLAAGANPNALDSKGETPVNAAISGGNFEGLKLLLNRGGDIKMKPRKESIFHLSVALLSRRSLTWWISCSKPVRM